MPDKSKITQRLTGLKGCFVAGGAVTSLFTNKPINDFDIYPKSEKALEDAIFWAFEDAGGWNNHASSRAISFKMKADEKGDEPPDVQIMHFDTFESAYKIFEAFDFTCCMGAFDLDTEEFILHSEFLEHCSQRFLSFNPATRFPYASACRVKKYEDRGFTIGRMEFQKILLACAEKPINSWEDLKEQLGGVYGEAITIPEGEDFSRAGMWKAVNTLHFTKDPCGYPTAEEAIASISGREIPVLQHNDTNYADFGDGSWTAISKMPKVSKLVTLDDILKEKTFFKKVVVSGDHFKAPHRGEFIYRMGEEAVAIGPGLYVYNDITSARQHHVYGTHDFAVLELKPSSVEDINLAGYGNPLQGVTLKKAKVIAKHDVSMPLVPVDLDEKPF